MIRELGIGAAAPTLPRPAALPARRYLEVPGWGPILRWLVSPALALLAAWLWFGWLRPVPPTDIGSIGLISRLPVPLLVSYLVLVAAVLVELLRTRPRRRLVALYTAFGVLAVYGLQPAVEQTGRLSVGWLHVGFARYITEHGQLLQGYDARFSWPGFFSLFAMISGSSGQIDLAPLLQWTPVVLAGLGTLAMRAMATAVLGPGRRAWIATWIFLLAQWTEQDYFSPQGTTYVLMLGAFALVLRYLVRPGLLSPERGSLHERAVPVGTARDRVFALAAVVLITLALLPTHQLTPFMFAAALAVLWCTGRLWVGWLPLAVLVGAVTWFALGARDFWQGQLHMVLGDIGHVSSAFGQGIGEHFVGDAGRTLILDARIGLTLVIAGLAAAGWFMLRRNGIRSWVLPLLAIVPFGVIVVQSYGGEVFLRCYLFSLPFSAMLGAIPVGALLDRATAGRWVVRGAVVVDRGRVLVWRTLALGTGVLLLAAVGLGTVTVRGGNDAYTSYSRADAAAMRVAYQKALTGQTIAALNSAVPISFNRVGNIDQITLEAKCSDLPHMENCVLDRMPDYLVITPSQENQGEIYDDLPRGWTAQVERALLASGEYWLVYDQGGSQVLTASTRSLPLAARPR